MSPLGTFEAIFYLTVVRYGHQISQVLILMIRLVMIVLNAIMQILLLMTQMVIW